MRPTFLTVLCILTFIWSGYTIISSFVSKATSKVTTTMVNDSKREIDSLAKAANTPEEQRAMRFAANITKGFDPEKLQKNAWVQAVASLFCLGGALLMWRLKRLGFYAYVIGTLIGIVAPFVILGTDNLIGLLTVAFGAFIGIVFCILYGLNFKDLK